MIDYIHASAYVGVISILLLLGPLCYYDIKDRKIPMWILILLLAINLPALFIMYSNGLPIFYLILSAAMALMFWILYRMGCYKGGDAKVLILIGLACPLNPINPNDQFFQIQYVIFLAAMAVLWMIYVYLQNRTALDPIDFKEMSLWQKFNNYPRGSPWMIPIAIAFVITVVLG